MKVNPRNVAGFLRRAFSMKETRNVEAVGPLNARRVLLEKTHGVWKGFRDARFSQKKIRKPGAVGCVSYYEFTVTMNATRILPEKTQGIWGVGRARIFHGKTHESAGVGHPWQINLQTR